MIGVLTLKTPLVERIERWATSGKAKSIPLHPQDYYVLSKAGHVDTIAQKYGLEVKCIGGEDALKTFIKDKMAEDES
jgi:hypothetical protein